MICAASATKDRGPLPGGRGPHAAAVAEETEATGGHCWVGGELRGEFGSLPSEQQQQQQQLLQQHSGRGWGKREGEAPAEGSRSRRCRQQSTAVTAALPAAPNRCPVVAAAAQGAAAPAVAATATIVAAAGIERSADSAVAAAEVIAAAGAAAAAAAAASLTTARRVKPTSAQLLKTRASRVSSFRLPFCLAAAGLHAAAVAAAVGAAASAGVSFCSLQLGVVTQAAWGRQPSKRRLSSSSSSSSTSNSSNTTIKGRRRMHRPAISAASETAEAAAAAMISAYGQPAAVSLPCPPTEESRSSFGFGSSSKSSSERRSIRLVSDLQVSPCGLYIAVVSPWGLHVYSNGQCRMLLGSCMLPRESEVYGHLCCCCWALDSSAVFVSADPAAFVCVFSIGSSRRTKAGLLQQQFQQQQQQRQQPAAAAAADGLTSPSSAAPAAAAAGAAAGGDSWLLDGFAAAGNTRRMSSVSSSLDGDAQDSTAEEEEQQQLLQPAAAEHAVTAEEAIRSLPSLLTAYRPKNTYPISVVLCLLLRLPVRPSAICCSPLQQQQLLLLGCSRQPAIMWLHLGGLRQVLGCLYTTDFIRVVRRAGVCPATAGPTSAAAIAAATATAAAAAAACRGRTVGASATLGCPCSGCSGRCCCVLEDLEHHSGSTFRSSSTVSAAAATAAAETPTAAAAVRASKLKRCRCAGRRKPLTYIYHPKGYTAVTELLRLSTASQDAQLLPDLPDRCLFSVASCAAAARVPSSSLRVHSSSSTTTSTSSRSSVAAGSLWPGRPWLSRDGSYAFSASETRAPLRFGSDRTIVDAAVAAASQASHWRGSNGCSSCSTPSGAAARSSSSSSSDSSSLESHEPHRGCSGLLLPAGSRRGRRRWLHAEAYGRVLEGGPGEGALSEGDMPASPSMHGVRQLLLDRREDLLAVVTAAGELMLLAWRFPLRGLTTKASAHFIMQETHAGECSPAAADGAQAAHEGAQQTQQSGGPLEAAESPKQSSGGSRSISSLSGGSSRKKWWNIRIGAGLDGRISIGYSAPSAATAEASSAALTSSSSSSRRRRWRPMGLLLREEGVCCCALNGERSLAAVGLASGDVEVYRLLWPRHPVQRARKRMQQQQRQQHQQQQQEQQEQQEQQLQEGQKRVFHRDVERDGFTLLPQLQFVLSPPEDIRSAAAAERAATTAGLAGSAGSAAGACYLAFESVQSLQWTADGAAVAVHWLHGGTAVFSHSGRCLFALPTPPSAGASCLAAAATRSPSVYHETYYLQKLHHQPLLPVKLRTLPLDLSQRLSMVEATAAAAAAAAAAAGAAAGAGQLCCWIMGGLGLLLVSPSAPKHAALQQARSGSGSMLSMPDTFESMYDSAVGPQATGEQLLEVAVLRSASLAAAPSTLDGGGSRWGSDLTDRVLLGGSELLVWSFSGSGEPPAISFIPVPLPPSLYTSKAFPVRQAALSPDGSQLLVAGSRGVALFALLQRRWRLLCSDRQEAQLPVCLLPLGWYTGDIFFVCTPTADPAAPAAAAAAAAPESRSSLGPPDAAPRWLLPLHALQGLEAAVAAAVESCPTRFAAHVPYTIHERTVWLQQRLQQQQEQQLFSSLLWGGGTASSTDASRLSSTSAVTAARNSSKGTGGFIASSSIGDYALLFLRSSERLDLRCRIAEVPRLPGRPLRATVLPRLQQEQLLRPTTARDSRCCICHGNTTRSSSSGCCIVCSGAAALLLRRVAAGDPGQPLLAIYDAQGILTAYQLQQQQDEQQQHDVAALWQLDLSDYCERPPQQIRFVGCAWLLLLLLQSGDALLLRLGLPSLEQQQQQRVHHIPRLVVEAIDLLAQGVTGVWVGAEAQLQQHYLLPSSRFRMLRSRCMQKRQQGQQQQKPTADGGKRPPLFCCCGCIAAEPASRADFAQEQQQQRQQQQPEQQRQQRTVASTRSRFQRDSVREVTLSARPDAEALTPVSPTQTSAELDATGEAAGFKRPSSLEGARVRLLPSAGPRAFSLDEAGSAAATEATAIAAGLAPALAPSRRISGLVSPAGSFSFQGFVDFPRAAAALPFVSTSFSHSGSSELQDLQQPQEQLSHLVREARAPLSLPVLAAERRPASAGSRSNPARADPLAARAVTAAAAPDKKHLLQQPWQAFWVAGRSRLPLSPQTSSSLEAYARCSSCVPPAGALAAPAADAAAATLTLTAAATRKSAAAVSSHPLAAAAAAVGNSRDGLELPLPSQLAPSSSAFKDSEVDAQAADTGVDRCDLCCCCIAGWHIWAQTAAGLLLASVGFHYSGAAAAAAADAAQTPEGLLNATDVRLRCALLLPVEMRPQPLHIIGIVGALGVAVACSPCREAAPSFPLHIQPIVQLRLLLQPCMQALLQRLLIAAAARVPLEAESPSSAAELSDLAAQEQPSTGANASTNCGSNSSEISTRSTSSTSSRLFGSVAELLCELQVSPFAHHLLELCQYGLLMRCISTYSKAAKSPARDQQHRQQQGDALKVPDETTAALTQPARNSKSAVAAAALLRSAEGVALQRLLRLLQQQSPQLFVATMVACMRKTEPLVSPAVLGCLLEERNHPADPVALFTRCLEGGMLHTASLYLLPIQTIEGPLQVRCRRVAPLLRAALAAGQFSLARKLLHFFWAFFRCWSPAEGGSSARSSIRQQQQEQLRTLAAVNEVGRRRRQSFRAQGRQRRRHLSRGKRSSRQQVDLRPLLWRPLQQELQLSAACGSTAAASAAAEGEPWLSRVPLELPSEDRLLAARVYQEVEAAVAAVAAACLQQQQWLRLFEFATALALDLPAWLRNSSNLCELQPCAARHQQKQQEQHQQPSYHRQQQQRQPDRKELQQQSDRHQQQQQLGLTGDETPMMQPVPTGTQKGLLAQPADAEAERKSISSVFFSAVSSFLLQLPAGDEPISLHLQRRLAPALSVVQQQQKRHNASFAEQREDPMLPTSISSSKAPVSQLPLLCSNGSKQREVAGEIARYLANVLLLTGLPLHTLALAAAVRDRRAAAQILSWYPHLRECFLASPLNAHTSAGSIAPFESEKEAELRRWVAHAATAEGPG
ncbi:hypothetical protein ACSSS7_003042 [Eimeria intestinalis]